MTDATTVTSETSIKTVLQKMQSNFIKYIVVQINNKPVGIVTERDINKFLENDKTARALGEVSIDLGNVCFSDYSCQVSVRINHDY